MNACLYNVYKTPKLRKVLYHELMILVSIYKCILRDDLQEGVTHVGPQAVKHLLKGPCDERRDPPV